ncbi:MAG TPA: hypothetical protein VFN17_00515 [Nitrosarchaeum sp.]|nr:hypothetical protein [Nitrosarchaeum sp.]
MGEDVDKLYRETMQEIIGNLKIRTEKILKILREEAKKNRLKLDKR